MDRLFSTMKQTITYILFFLMLFSTLHCTQKHEGIVGYWQMHRIVHVRGETERDRQLNKKFSNKEVIWTFECKADSSFEQVRNHHAPQEPVNKGTFSLREDMLLIHDVFGSYEIKVLKLTADSLVLLYDDFFQTYYRISATN